LKICKETGHAKDIIDNLYKDPTGVIDLTLNSSDERNEFISQLHVVKHRYEMFMLSIGFFEEADLLSLITLKSGETQLELHLKPRRRPRKAVTYTIVTD
jgi:hypothetical protein